MKDAEDSADDTDSTGQGNSLRLVHSEKRERLLLKTLIKEMKGQEKRKRVKLSFDEGPDVA
ncbi:MAG: hypothetical protein LC803_16805 [Acidobacteria bacterium]|nr:hypothetical protein [Acidobacteriota bacterium]